MPERVEAHFGTAALIRVAEPAGERTFEERLTIGGAGAQIVVPGAGSGPALHIGRRDAVWSVRALDNGRVVLDGAALYGVRDLRRGDVLGVGGAQVLVTTLGRNLLELAVWHPVGNATIAPTSFLSLESAPDQDVEIAPVAARTALLQSEAGAPGRKHRGLSALDAFDALRTRALSVWHTHLRPRLLQLGAAAALIALLGFLATFRPIDIEVRPVDARVAASDTWLAVSTGRRMFVRSGSHTLRAVREGYFPARVAVLVRAGTPAVAHLHLAKLPGRLRIDTRGVVARVRIDGVDAGAAPGEIEVPAGKRTLTLQAAHYLEQVVTLEIAGAGARQSFTVSMRPDWGTVLVGVVPSGAALSVDDHPEPLTVPDEGQPASASLVLDAGVHRVRLSAPPLKSWESSIVVQAGETLRVGTVRLGQADARLVLRSRPAGAAVSVARTFRGRTPLTLELAAGVTHEVVLSLAGYESWTRTIEAQPAHELRLDASLRPLMFGVSISGKPADAEVFIDGKARGHAPQSLQLLAVEHRIELRKSGFVPLITSVSSALGLDRTVQYQLMSTDRSAALQESAPTLTTRGGYVLHIVRSGTFLMAAVRGEAEGGGERAGRLVTFVRPFYMGAKEVTNAEFRRFQPEHSSGYLQETGQSLDRDAAAVTEVAWDDAVEYCNWLSRQEGLDPAYEQQGMSFALKHPVTLGYRLPTEAEWDYAVRHAEASHLDVSGNVSEWVNDLYATRVDGVPVTDPLGPAEGERHVIRGANWRTGAVVSQRLAWRDAADGPARTIGFRIARYAD